MTIKCLGGTVKYFNCLETAVKLFLSLKFVTLGQKLAICIRGSDQPRVFSGLQYLLMNNANCRNLH